ncbi:hypothetical protein GDO81_011848 [Engystomops pustulosus]|uniref:Uncharacterized protein n=1 Tax=Engystomops pustulosus TaxID=76066 RepID=A0AAV7BH78_ENGPU|nr:hypothetical protein GDO81_011848 [Engystomops pustulosus]
MESRSLLAGQDYFKEISVLLCRKSHRKVEGIAAALQKSPAEKSPFLLPRPPRTLICHPVMALPFDLYMSGPKAPSLERGD